MEGLRLFEMTWKCCRGVGEEGGGSGDSGGRERERVGLRFRRSKYNLSRRLGLGLWLGLEGQVGGVLYNLFWFSELVYRSCENIRFWASLIYLSNHGWCIWSYDC